MSSNANESIILHKILIPNTHPLPPPQRDLLPRSAAAHGADGAATQRLEALRGHAPKGGALRGSQGLQDPHGRHAGPALQGTGGGEGEGGEMLGATPISSIRRKYETKSMRQSPRYHN